jgi:hypothetical protein
MGEFIICAVQLAIVSCRKSSYVDQWHSYVFWLPGREITMLPPKKQNYGLKKITFLHFLLLFQYFKNVVRSIPQFQVYFLCLP